MKKKIIGLLVIMILLLQPVSVYAADTVTANGNGFTDVPFSNSYRGFCINWDFDGAYVGDQFAVVGTSPATTSLDGVDVSQQLKLLFTQCFGDIFEENSNGGYTMKGGTIPSDVQYTIYHYTDNFKNNWGNQLTWIGVIDGYNGSPIPDNGYVLTLENGDKITFNFMVMKTGNAEQQNFFGYKIAVTKASNHEHDYADAWSGNEKEHWHECECGDKADKEEHSGGTASCDKEAVCEDCGKPYGEKDKDNHVGETEIKNAKEATTEEEGYTGDTYCKDCGEKIADGEKIPKIHKHEYSDVWSSGNGKHWHECKCGDKKDVASHTYKDGKCTVCGAKKNPGYVPQTGDDSQSYLWAGALILSVCCLVALLRKLKRNNVS